MALLSGMGTGTEILRWALLVEMVVSTGTAVGKRHHLAVSRNRRWREAEVMHGAKEKSPFSTSDVEEEETAPGTKAETSEFGRAN